MAEKRVEPAKAGSTKVELTQVEPIKATLVTDKKPEPLMRQPGPTTQAVKQQAAVTTTPPVVKEEVPLLVRCVDWKMEQKTVKVTEGKVKEGEDKGKPAYHECVRPVYCAQFVTDEPDTKLLPNATIMVESLEVLPFEEGKKYSLELSEVKE